MGDVYRFFGRIAAGHKKIMKKRLRWATFVEKVSNRTAHRWEYVGANYNFDDIYKCSECGATDICGSFAAAEHLPLFCGEEK